MAQQKGLSPIRFLSGLAPILLLAGCTQSSAPELRVMTWTEYLRPEVIQEFEKAQNAKVILDYFSSNEELLAKVDASIQSGGRGYDLILPSDYMVTSMVRLNMLNAIEKPKLAFLESFDPVFLHPDYDRELAHSIPFAWGTTGVAVNTKLAPKLNLAAGVSWKDLFENLDYKGKVILMDDTREVVHSVLLIQGKKWSTATEDDIKAAFDYLKKHKSNIKIFASEPKPVIQADECVLCQAFSGDVELVAKNKPEIKYLIPKEGATRWADNWAIPKNAKNVALAMSFLNKILSDDGSRRFTEATFYPTPNQKARELLKPEYKNNSAIYPDPETLRRLEFISERPELLKLMDRLWTELKSN